MPNLRGHHLICLQFFGGEGYNTDFVENLMNVMEAVESGGSVVCRGADDVCRRCPHLEEDSCRYSEGADEEIRKMDRRALGLLKIREGARIRWTEIKEKLPLIFRPWYETYCNSCGWKRTCEKNGSYLNHLRTLL